MAKTWNPRTGRYEEPPALDVACREMIRSWRSSAEGLQREIDNGVALRQSLESKASRVQVLRVCADELERALEAKVPGR